MNENSFARTLRYVGIIISIAAILYGVAMLRGCNKPRPSNNVGSTIDVPADTNFIPVENKTYQPPSVPFLSSKKSGVKLPKGYSERDVSKVTSLVVSSDDSDSLTTLDVIEMNNGDVFVGKDPILKSVKVTIFEPSVFSFCLKFGAGVSAGLDNGLHFSPMGTVALAEWNIARLNFHAPIVTADLDGVGAGVQLQLYHDFYVGAFKEWRFDSGSQVKACLNYML